MTRSYGRNVKTSRTIAKCRSWKKSYGFRFEDKGLNIRDLFDDLQGYELIPILPFCALSLRRSVAPLDAMPRIVPSSSQDVENDTSALLQIFAAMNESQELICVMLSEPRNHFVTAKIPCAHLEIAIAATIELHQWLVAGCDCWIFGGHT